MSCIVSSVCCFLSSKAWREAPMKMKAGAEEITFAKVTKAFSKLSKIVEDKAICYYLGPK